MGVVQADHGLAATPCLTVHAQADGGIHFEPPNRVGGDVPTGHTGGEHEPTRFDAAQQQSASLVRRSGTRGIPHHLHH